MLVKTILNGGEFLNLFLLKTDLDSSGMWIFIHVVFYFFVFYGCC